MSEFTSRPNCQLMPMKAVYSFLYPETRTILKRVEQALTDEIFRVTTSARRAEEILEGIFLPALSLPALPGGTLDLDMLHIPVIERIVQAYSSQVPALKNFPWSYYGAGSSDLLFHLLAQLKVSDIDKINVLEGEYEGYAAQANNLRMKCQVHDPFGEALWKLPAGAIFFISQPSAANGMIIGNDFINRLCDAGYKVVLDLSYVGSTAPFEFDVSHENVIAALLSFSKPYGTFRFRVGGFAFMRAECPSLYGNKWFKDCSRILQSLLLAESIGPSGLYEKYRSVQMDAIRELNQNFSIELKPSAVILLAHMNVIQESQQKVVDKTHRFLSQFERGKFYRLCLTPFFERSLAAMQVPSSTILKVNQV